MQSEKNIISNPLKEIYIGENKYDSLINIYVKNRDFYNQLNSIRNVYNVEISAVIKEFFRTTPKPSKGKSIDNKIKYYEGKWKIYINARRVRIEQIRALEKQSKDLVDNTVSGQCIWEEKSSSIISGVRRKNYTVIYDGVCFKLQVISTRNVDGEWRTSLELTREGADKKIEVCPKDYNAILYNAIQKTVLKPEKQIAYVKRREPGVEKKEVQINHGDFVVRTNLFRCFYKEHLVEEIIGILRIVTPLGIEIIEHIPCAYCSECKCFYMLTSEYNRVAEKGILLCQLISKEEYYKAGIPSKFAGASESLLMRNGYNVKANIGLTDVQRQIILRNIMDSGILSPHRIASYLDTFIAQKRKMPQYNDAVLKWQKDKSYVLSYNEKEKRKVTIESIKK